MNGSDIDNIWDEWTNGTGQKSGINGALLSHTAPLNCKDDLTYKLQPQSLSIF